MNLTIKKDKCQEGQDGNDVRKVRTVMTALLKVYMDVLTASKSAVSEHTAFNRTRCTTITANQPIMRPVR